MAVRMGNATPWVGATGCQDADCHVKMTPDAVFRIGSITKTFVGVAILEQADEGKLRLDDTLEQWLPGVFAHIDGRGITLRQLLNHTSGIENFTDSLGWGVTVYKTPTHRGTRPTSCSPWRTGCVSPIPRCSLPARASPTQIRTTCCWG